ncbi:MAG: two component transcriptional regulator, LuxR family [Planctomycetaceae bacterium]|nr:two component transcriptional regulator, LuxR family [Planctomycetaceae bacterium]
MAKIRIIVADDHTVLRAGLRLLINTQPDMEVVSEAADHVQALKHCREFRPTVLTLDMSMPGGNGIQTIQELCRDCPETRILVLTMHDAPAYFRMAIASGAMGYVTKTAAADELLNAIRHVAAGKVFTHATLAHDNLAEPTFASQNTALNSPLESLSEREREVLLQLAQGHTNQAIADQLRLSVKTVESYRARMMSKLGLQNRAELTKFAIASGLLNSPEIDRS